MAEGKCTPSPEREAWIAVLDELEASLGNAALGTSIADLEVPAPVWTPPTGLGPIPPDLVGRARDILGGQRELIAEIDRQRRAVGEQLAALRQVPAARAQAVYVDIVG